MPGLHGDFIVVVILLLDIKLIWHFGDRSISVWRPSLHTTAQICNG